MNKPFKLIKLLVFALLLTTFSCSNDDDNAVVINLEDLEVTIDENPNVGQVIGIVQSSTGSASNFSITAQTPAGVLSIDANTGELTVVDAMLFDFETNPVITATITADDAANTATVTINLNDINELSAQDLTVALDENPTDGQVVGTIQVNSGGTLSFSITRQTPVGALNINASTGELTVLDPNLFDFETNPVITATIQVEDAPDVTSVFVTINLNDVDEITVQNLTTDIDENPTNGQVLGTLMASSAGSLSYTITYQSTAGALAINQSTGELSVADETLFDFETNPSMFATISVDNGVYSVSGNATINLNNVNEIGDFNYGGVIFWVDPTSNNSAGLVCNVNDLNNGASIQWYNGTNTDTGAIASDLGTGEANTAAIISSQGAGDYAATLCNNLSLNGYSDWYLPSQDELTEMYNNRTTINASAIANGGTNFITLFYWSSTQQNGNANNAWIHYFSNGTQGLNAKGNSAYVRAIRTFTDF
ncbi:DUF1566 domain-containing protein [Algibacter sp.]|nr:DUF1566 domain-containing protein [Algibacter sp.]